ncbi:MAG: hydrogenase maturation nickel metallochaperone HypA [Phycisphaerae bacterium]|jgi:hydrogenase nickel incorporation protein HypA/HybF
MHEGAIAESILRVAMEATPKDRPKITRVTVVAGALSGVENEPLLLWFGHLSKGTPAEGATMVITRAAARLVCKDCRQRRDYDGAGPLDPRCAVCGSNVSLEGGDELYVESVEVE